MKAGVFFDAWMEAFCSKGLTFSGHFFEMIIHYLAAGGAAVLLANGVNLSQIRQPFAGSPVPLCQCLIAVSPAKNADRGEGGVRSRIQQEGKWGFFQGFEGYIDVYVCLHQALSLAASQN